MKASVIMSTYNAEAWLQKVLWGFSAQTEQDFEIIIADDGSGPKTAELIARMRNELKMPVKHVWHPDNGFQKCMILNRAILAAETDYLIFTDGDCIPRADFVATHLKFRRPKHFLSGGYFKLPMITSETITKEDIIAQRCFDVHWLQQNGLKSVKKMKLSAKGFLATLLNAVTPTKATWNGHNASCWKHELLAINGFNHEMQYGGEDRELGERLVNNGLQPVQIRYSAICVHLDHARGYVSDAVWKKNNEIREYTQKHKVIKTPVGIAQL